MLRRVEAVVCVLQPGIFALLSVVSCGGKIAPRGDAADYHDAGLAAVDSGGRPIIDHVDPSSGPNSGGTTVAIRGSGFDTDGGTQVTFAGFPASHVSCASETECVVLSPWAGPSSVPQVVDVQATVRGVLGDPNALTSATSQADLFTFAAGPNCSATQVCNAVYLPQIVLECPTESTFYLLPWTNDEELVADSTSYTAESQVCGGAIAACNGSPTNGSCSSYSLQASATLDCGTANFCGLCKNVFHGFCSRGPDPLCCTAICQSTLPMPACP